MPTNEFSIRFKRFTNDDVLCLSIVHLEAQVSLSIEILVLHRSLLCFAVWSAS